MITKIPVPWYLKFKDSDERQVWGKFYDEKYFREVQNETDAHWLFVEPAFMESEENGELWVYWPIHPLTTISDIMRVLADPDLPPSATWGWNWPEWF